MRRRDTWVLVATIVGSSLAFIDGAVVTLALPRIQHDFHATGAGVAWVVELYALVIGACMLLAGALADRFGRKRVFIIGVSLFTLGSIGCAFASSLLALLAMRVLQALGGTLLTPASLAIIGAHFDAAKRGRAIAAWSALGALTSSIGPLAGGVLIDTFGWRAVFWINVPLAALVLFAAFTHLEESRDEDAPRALDYAGAMLAIAGFGGVTYALLSHNAFGWLGVLALAWFVLHEYRVRNPLIPPKIFASRTFSSLNLSTFLLYGALGGVTYEIPFAMIQGHGYRASQAAVAMLPFAIPLVLLPRFSSSLARRLGTRLVLSIGPLVVACGFALLEVLNGNHAYLASFFPGLLLAGIGMGLTVAPLTTSVIASGGLSHVGIASAINTAIARIASLVTVAAFTVLVASVYHAQFDRALTGIHATASQRHAVAAQQDRLGGARFSDPALSAESRIAFGRGVGAAALAAAILAGLASAVNAAGVRDRELQNA